MRIVVHLSEEQNIVLGICKNGEQQQQQRRSRTSVTRHATCWSISCLEPHTVASFLIRSDMFLNLGPLLACKGRLKPLEALFPSMAANAGKALAQAFLGGPSSSPPSKSFPHTAMAETAQSLRTSFLAAERQRGVLELHTGSSSSEYYQEQVRAALGLYEACQQAVHQLSLFSPNEAADDISSNDLQSVFACAGC